MYNWYRFLVSIYHDITVGSNLKKSAKFVSKAKINWFFKEIFGMELPSKKPAEQVVKKFFQKC